MLHTMISAVNATLRVISTGRVALLIFSTILLSIISGCNQVIETVSPPDQPQLINYVIPSGKLDKSAVSFTKTLDQGVEVRGFAEIDEVDKGDEFFDGLEWNYEWVVQIFDSKGEPQIPEWVGHWKNNNRFEFSFTTTGRGSFRIRIAHYSVMDKRLIVEILPTGWKIPKP
jgi:hypothetical protein